MSERRLLLDPHRSFGGIHTIVIVQYFPKGITDEDFSDDDIYTTLAKNIPPVVIPETDEKCEYSPEDNVPLSAIQGRSSREAS
ncbi:hypothetical protein EVAR_64405_1 [Eumeta japonica]|uniref:Uncharacterized protein n=1 Tax=Eumeta variegata TaxID=151549 RepID=A0A4C2A2K7_EUMVA|nr:hypothetical protein EVAR_64405_1 [Eumeta japonica]